MIPLPQPLGSGHIRLWRLDQNRHAITWDSGEGAYRVGGRWNSRRVRAVYTSVDPACLPPYSPDLIPIQKAFSKLKANLRRIGARAFTDLFQALGDICDLLSPDERWNFFKAAGDVAGQYRNALNIKFICSSGPQIRGLFERATPDAGRATTS